MRRVMDVLSSSVEDRRVASAAIVLKECPIVKRFGEIE
jgi:hypothetical protein